MDPLLCHLYQGQQGNLRLIADELREMGEVNDVCGFYCYDLDMMIV
jgi:hypothetical protein